MVEKSKNIKLLLKRYQALMEKAYNNRQTDPALSDCVFFEGLKLRKLLEIKHHFKFNKSTQDLLN